MKELRQVLLFFAAVFASFTACAVFHGGASPRAAEAESISAQVIQNGKAESFSSIQEALDFWESGTTLRLLQSANVGSIEVSGKKTLDLNGFSLCGDGSDSVIRLLAQSSLTVMGEGEICGGKARRGGGIYGENAALNLYGATVKGNFAKEGGGIYLKNCSFKANGGAALQNQAEKGGGLCLFESKAELVGFSISQNEALISGGGIFLWGEEEDTALSLGKDTMLSENRAAECGGGISSFSRGRITLQGGKIQKNSAKFGGGIFLQGGQDGLSYAKATIENGELTQNTATLGGGVNIVSNGILHVKDANIAENIARLGGGVAISLYGEAIFSKNCTVKDNYLQGGGAGNVFSERSGQVTVEANFTGEIGFSMPRGGAIGTVGTQTLEGLFADEADKWTLSAENGELNLCEIIQSDNAENQDPDSNFSGTEPNADFENSGVGSSTGGGQSASVESSTSTREGERAIAIMIAISAACAVLFLAAGIFSRIFKKRQE